MLEYSRIVVAISGGIAAYKSAMLVRLLVKAGCEVQVVMTPNAKEFISPVTLSTLSGKPVISEFFTANTGEWHSHVDLGLWADAFVVAPATASTIGKMANGIADNMLVTSYLSTRAKVFVAPAMDLDMYAHPTTQRNLKTLQEDGVEIIEPGSGELASHLVGKGRMAEPEEIFQAVDDYISSKTGQLKGKKVLITAGPTYENIDPVRFIGNYSSGKMGFALAEACAGEGAEVVLVAGPVSLKTKSKLIRRIDVTSAKEMLEACEKEFPACNCAILCAAVSDYSPAEVADKKLKREKTGELNLRLVPNPDIAATLGAMKGDKMLVGFALETDNEKENAIAKMKRKNFDWIVLNSLNDPEAGFRKDTNKITMIGRGGMEIAFPAKSKDLVAEDIIETIATIDCNDEGPYVSCEEIPF